MAANSTAIAKGKPSIGWICAKYGIAQGLFAVITGTVASHAGVSPIWAGLPNIVALIVVMVLAHREFKLAHDGSMSYLQGLGVASLTGTIAATVTSVLVFILTKYVDAAMMVSNLQAQRLALQQRGLTQLQIDQTIASTSSSPESALVGTLVISLVTVVALAAIVPIGTRKGRAAVIE